MKRAPRPPAGVLGGMSRLGRRAGGVLGALLTLHVSLLTAALPCAGITGFDSAAAHAHHHDMETAMGATPADMAMTPGSAAPSPAPRHAPPAHSPCCDAMASCTLQRAPVGRVELAFAAQVAAARAVAIVRPLSVVTSPDTPPPRA